MLTFCSSAFSLVELAVSFEIDVARSLELLF
jgi:hypothetical protein